MFMNGIIIISKNDKQIKEIYEQWKYIGKNMSSSLEDLRMSLPEGNIYIHLWEEGYQFYDDELKKINYKEKHFYLVDYSNSDTLIFFLKNTIFSEDCYFDNDNGMIVSLKQLRKNINSFVYFSTDTL